MDFSHEQGDALTIELDDNWLGLLNADIITAPNNNANNVSQSEVQQASVPSSGDSFSLLQDLGLDSNEEPKPIEVNTLIATASNGTPLPDLDWQELDVEIIDDQPVATQSNESDNNTSATDGAPQLQPQQFDSSWTGNWPPFQLHNGQQAAHEMGSPSSAVHIHHQQQQQQLPPLSMMLPFPMVNQVYYNPLFPYFGMPQTATIGTEVPTTVSDQPTDINMFTTTNHTTSTAVTSTRRQQSQRRKKATAHKGSTASKKRARATTNKSTNTRPKKTKGDLGTSQTHSMTSPKPSRLPRFDETPIGKGFDLRSPKHIIRFMQSQDHQFLVIPHRMRTEDYLDDNVADMSSQEVFCPMLDMKREDKPLIIDTGPSGNAARKQYWLYLPWDKQAAATNFTLSLQIKDGETIKSGDIALLGTRRFKVNQSQYFVALHFKINEIGEKNNPKDYKIVVHARYGASQHEQIESSWFTILTRLHFLRNSLKSNTVDIQALNLDVIPDLTSYEEL